MAFLTNAGTQFEVSAGLPATHDVAGFAALTYTEGTKISDLGTIGPTDNIVTFTALRDENGEATVDKAQGSRDYGSHVVNMAYDDGNVDLVAIIKTAANARSAFSVKRTLPNGDIRYYLSISDGVREVGGDADSVLMWETTLHQYKSVVEDDA